MSEKHHFTVALRDDTPAGDVAPCVVAKGSGPIADEILRLAKKHDIPLRQDPALVGALAQLDPGAAMPPEMFRAAAEVVAFVFKINQKAR